MPTASIIGVFEGGGARGVAHVGALKAVEDDGMVFAAIAGTSAGAIIAALVAAGYRADEIFDPDRPRENLIRQITGRGPTGLFAGWWRLALLRRGLALARHPITHLHLTATASVLAMWLAEHGWHHVLLGWKGGQWLQAMGVVFLGLLLCGVTLAVVIHPLLLRRGLFPTAPMVREFDRMLRRKVGPEQCGPVTFRQLHQATAIDLAVVATDFHTGSAVVFDRINHPDVAVARAVAASIAVPVLLQPVEMALGGATIRGPMRRPAARLMDGGMVSNLPAWLFEARRRQGRLKTAAFMLDDGPAKAGGVLGYWARVANIAIFGGQGLASRSVPDLTAVRLRCAPLGMLDFDVAPDQACAVHGRARRDARIGLARLSGAAEAIITGVLAALAADEARHSTDACPAVSIVVPATPEELLVRFHHQARDPAALATRLPLHGSIAGECLRRQAALIWRARDNTWLTPADGGTGTLSPQPPLRDVACMFAVPILRGWSDPARPGRTIGQVPFAVFCIDFRDDQWEYFQQSEVLLFYRGMAGRLSELLLPFETWRFFDGFDAQDAAGATG